MIQEIFLNGFHITFCEIFLQGFENIFFYIFTFNKKPYPEIFLKRFHNISLENVGEINFGETLKNLAVTFLKVLFHDVHTVEKCCENFAKTFQAMIQEIFLNGFL